jgi:hypothetical protein
LRGEIRRGGDVRRESVLTLGQTVGFICGALALVALLFSVFAWFTRRSRPAKDPVEATYHLANWVPVVGAAVLAGIALIAYEGTSKSTSMDGQGGHAGEAAASPGPIAEAASMLSAAEAGGAEPEAGVPAGSDQLTVADKVAAVDQHGGGSMQGAVAGLERRLAAKGGSDADWELLAKSYEFLGRTSDAAQARNKHVPAGAGDGIADAAAAPAGTGSTPLDQKVRVDGEVILADALRDKVPAGLTLFIVAKSVKSPGPPVAILRTTTNAWPVHFSLDDTQAMMPQRKLSTAGPVTIEARTSKSGQAMPERGDFQGVTTALDPSAGKPIRIVIERVIS